MNFFVIPNTYIIRIHSIHKFFGIIDVETVQNKADAVVDKKNHFSVVIIYFG